MGPGEPQKPRLPLRLEERASSRRADAYFAITNLFRLSTRRMLTGTVLR